MKSDSTPRRLNRVSPLDLGPRPGAEPNAELEADGIALGSVAIGSTVLPFALPERVRRNATQYQLQQLGLAFDLVRDQEELLRHLEEVVGWLRESGLSWETIGWVTGLTAAGARKRWMPATS